jgi:tryptophan synthase alpha chain
MSPSRIDELFCRLEAQKRLGLFAYVTVGYPDPAAGWELARLVLDAGADLLELGIPFSDPLADGATIQRASHRALRAGTRPEHAFELAARLRDAGYEQPLVVMTYLNPVVARGEDRFCADLAAAGVDGLIIPDLPPDEAGLVGEAARRHGIDLVFLAAPNSPDDRLRKVAAAATGFIYCVSLTGVTGARDALAPGLDRFLARVRAVSGLPLAVGFGISRPEQVRALRGLADAVIVGSGLIDRVEAAPPEQWPAVIRAYIGGLRAAGAG